MKKHMYLRILWPYIVGIAVFIVFYLLNQSTINFIGDSFISLFFLSWLFLPLPLIVSIILLIKDYRSCNLSQKIVCISLNSLALLSIIVSAIFYYNFMTNFRMGIL